MQMDQLPDELVLRGSRLKWLGYMLITTPLMIAGALIISDTGLQVTGWIVFLMFAACSLLFLCQIIWPGRLTLQRDGFEQVVLGRKMSCRWEDTSNFGVHVINQDIFQTNEIVCFDRKQDEGKRLAELNRSVAGATAQLGDTFGMKAEELAGLMSAFRDRVCG